MTQGKYSALDPQAQKTILELSHGEARNFLLKSSSYCNLDLPRYIDFAELLQGTREAVMHEDLCDLNKKAKRFDGVNFVILDNKDGKNAWRPFELMHPALYVSLVLRMTEEVNWRTIVERFRVLAGNKQIRCQSLPLVSETNATDKAGQVSVWWQDVEQLSIELSLDFQYMIETDISDCYRSLYTHSIAWALHTKEVAKKNRECKEYLGNAIDCTIQAMRNGQTNGIPQGSVLMDLIAEMVLGLGDETLSGKISNSGVSDYRILRFRDDYRIFFNNPLDGENIVKLLAETTFELGFKLNESKTRTNKDVVHSSLKVDKIAWLKKRHDDESFQRQLLIIQDHASQFPNGGSLMGPLNELHAHLVELETLPERPMPLIAIVTDIALRNPRTFPICSAILSSLLQHIDTVEARVDILEQISRRFSVVPNTGLMQIWLQRVVYPYAKDLAFENEVCKLVRGEKIDLWNSKWISNATIASAAESHKIVNCKKLAEQEEVVSSSEVSLFSIYL